MATILAAAAALGLSFWKREDWGIYAVAITLLVLAINLVVERYSTEKKLDRIIRAIDSSKDIPEGVRFFPKVSDAPSLDSYLEEAKKEILLVGPVRYALVFSKDRYEKLLLNKAQKCEVKIVINADNPEAVSLWEGSGYSNTKDELSTAHKVFNKWQQEARDNHLKLHAKKQSGLIPFTLNVIDGGTKAGKMLVILIPRGTAPDDRPAFEVTRTGQMELFDQIYSKALEIWKTGDEL